MAEEANTNSAVAEGQVEPTGDAGTTPGDTNKGEAPGTTGEQSAGDSGNTNYEEQYKNLQAGFTKQAQELAEYKRREEEAAVGKLAETQLADKPEDIPEFLQEAPEEQRKAYKMVENAIMSKVMKQAQGQIIPVVLAGAVDWAKSSIKDFNENDPQLIAEVRNLSGARFSTDPLTDMKEKIRRAHLFATSGKLKEQGAEEARRLDAAKSASASLERGGTSVGTRQPKLSGREFLRKTIRESGLVGK